MNIWLRDNFVNWIRQIKRVDIKYSNKVLPSYATLNWQVT